MFGRTCIQRGILISVVNVNKPEYFNPGIQQFTFASRPGAEADKTLAERVFGDMFGFELFEETSFHSINMQITKWNHEFPPDNTENQSVFAQCPCLTCRIKRFDFTPYDGLVFTISSHGNEENGETFLQFVDGYRLPVSEIYKTFSDSVCPSLRNKPRILFIQGCRTDVNRQGNIFL